MLMKIKLSSPLFSAILLLTLAVGAAASSPTVVISAGSASGNPGDTNINVPVSLQSKDGAHVVGLNFDLSFDDNRLNVSSVTIGPAASGAGKIMSWSQLSTSTVRVIIFGLNQDMIPNGTVANVIFNVLDDAAPETSHLVLSNAAATDPSSSGIGVRLNNGSFTVFSLPATNTTTSSVTPTPNTKASPEGTASPIGEPSASPTSALEGGILTDLELAAMGTGTAIAGLEAAVEATATALAVIGQEPAAGVETVSGLSLWLRQRADVVLLGGIALGATMLVGSLFFEVWRRRVSESSRKRIC